MAYNLIALAYKAIEAAQRAFPPWDEQITHTKSPARFDPNVTTGEYSIREPPFKGMRTKGPEVGYLNYYAYPSGTHYKVKDKPVVSVGLMGTSEGYQLQGVATALLRRMVQDYPGHVIDPGVTTSHGTALKHWLMENLPEEQRPELLEGTEGKANVLTDWEKEKRIVPNLTAAIRLAYKAIREAQQILAADETTENVQSSDILSQGGTGNYAISPGPANLGHPMAPGPPTVPVIRA